MLASRPQDTPLGIQLLGCEEKYLRKAFDILKARYAFSLIDFNAACPSKKVVRRGEGARLLESPHLLQKLLGVLVRLADVPVTVKIRTGWDAHSVNAVSVALRAQDAGVNAVFVHGRTKMQGYQGGVDYRTISDVKRAVKIPVIASGDIFSPGHVKLMYDETGCDGVVVARGALGNPWFFRRTYEFLSRGILSVAPERIEISRVMREHLESACDFHGERIGVVSFRKFFVWYTKGFRRIRSLREDASRAKTKSQMLRIVDRCVDEDASRITQ